MSSFPFPNQTGLPGSSPLGTNWLPSTYSNQTAASSPTSTPGATAPSATAPQLNTSNQLFGSPEATSMGAAGKGNLTQGPQLSLGAKGGSNLASTGSQLAPLRSSLGGGK